MTDYISYTPGFDNQRTGIIYTLISNTPTPVSGGGGPTVPATGQQWPIGIPTQGS